MKSKSFQIIIIIYLLIVANANAIIPTVIGSVSSVHEASGLDFSGSSYWTHNDGYGDNKLYKLSSSGVLSRTVTITNATNNDWEDITSDEQKADMYIGDFGNNNCNRTNLKIYKIPYPSSTSSNSLTASVIRFSYPDQTRFPARWMNFDVEAFFHHDGKLFLFTKADGNAIGYSKLYTVPDQPGTYVADFIDSFPLSGRITGANVSPDGRSAVLISNTRIYLFSNFTGDNVFNGDYTKIKMDGGWTQKEGVCFNSPTSIYLIDEGSSNKLYSVSLSPYMRNGSENPVAEPENSSSFISENIYPNPAASYFNIRNTGDFENAIFALTDISGKLISNFTMTKMDEEIQINIEQFPAGIYFVQMIADNKRKGTARIIKN